MPSPRQIYKNWKVQVSNEQPVTPKVPAEIIELASNIRTRAKRLGITLDMVAKREGISRRKLYYWLAGKRMLNYYRQEQGLKGLKRIRRWLIRIEVGDLPFPRRNTSAPKAR